MDYSFPTTPASFTADLAAAAKAQNIPAALVTAIQAGWAATDPAKPTYQVDAAAGDFWTVVRIAAVLVP